MELSPEQRSLRDAVRDLLRRRPPVLGPGEDRQLMWRSLCDIGVAGLAIPERFGGAGAGPVEMNIVAEELGRLLAPAPLLGSAVLATQAILASGDAQACERLLPGLADGSMIGALAWTGLGGGWDPAQAAFHAAARTHRAGEVGGGWTLTGTAHYVLDGADADVLLAVATTPGNGVGLFEVDPSQPGVDRQVSVSMDQTRHLAVVRLAAAADRLLGPGHQAALARARDLACIALSAEQAGAAARALELTVAYTSTRVQFGRTIASFQAIQHRLADLHVLVESARAMSYHAARAAAAAYPAEPPVPRQAGRAAPAAPDTDVALLAAAAKAYCSEALSTVAAEMIQLHGAIGATWEHNAHRYFKRAHNSAQLFGPPSVHLAKIAHAIIDE